MRILQFTHKFPYPFVDGASLAVHALAKGLKNAGAVLDLFSLNTSKHFATSTAIDNLLGVGLYNTVTTANMDASESVIGAIKNFCFSNQSYFIDRYWSLGAGQALMDLLEEQAYDIVLMEGLYCTRYCDIVRKYAKGARVVLRAHNIEYELRRRQYERLGFSFEKIFLKSAIKRLMRAELMVFSQVDLIVTVSQREAEILGRKIITTPIVVAPIGMECPTTPKKKTGREKKHIGFIGSLDWRPNRDGLQWFVDEVWRPLSRLHNVLEFFIAGSYGDLSSMFREEDHINLLGQVEDSRSFVEDMDMMIVPLWTGSGTRVKIIESLCVGTPVLSTSLGAEGLNLHAGKGIMISDSSIGWQSLCRDLVQGNVDIRKLVTAGRRYVEDYHDINMIGRQVFGHMKLLLGD